MSPLLLQRRASDEELLRRIRAGDEDAFTALHARYAPALERYAGRIMGDRTPGPEDVVQEVFARAHGAIREDDRALAVRPWLYRLVRNRALDELRRPGASRTDAVAGDELDAGSAAAEGQADPYTIVARRQHLRSTLADVAALPERQREVLLLREVDGLSHEQLAGDLGITVRASKNLVLRARENLVKSAEARDDACANVRTDLLRAADGGRRASAHAYRHVAACKDCRSYRSGLGRVRGALHLLDPGPALLGALAAVGGIGSGLGGGAAAKLVTASAVTAAVAGGTLELGTKVFESGERAPLAVATVNAATIGGELERGDRVPRGVALVTQGMTLRAASVRHPGVELACPVGMKVAGLSPDASARVGHGFAPSTIVGSSGTARLVFERKRVRRDTDIVVSIVCKRPGASGSILAAPVLELSARTKQVCARRAYLFETPEGLPIGTVFRSQPVTIRRYAKGRRWVRIRTDAGVVGWVRRSALCR